MTSSQQPSVPDARTPAEVLALYGTRPSTLGELVSSRARMRGSEDAVLDVHRTLGWQGLAHETDMIAAALAARGLRRGDRVAVMSRNSVNYASVFIAVTKLGAILVPVNPDLTVAEARYILGHSKPAFVFGSEECLDLAHAALGASTEARIVVLDGRASGFESYLEWLDSPSNGLSSPDTVEGSDTCLILYTSGTTGRPKGVMHSHHSICLAAETTVVRMHLQPEDRMLCVLPFFHINALIYSLCGALAAGAALIIAPRFSASSFWQLAHSQQATQVNVIAAISRILARRPREEFVPAHGIRKLYGAPITADMYSVFREEFGIPALLEGYGLTEVPCVAVNPFGQTPMVGSMGVPAQHPAYPASFVEVKVLDDHGQALPDGMVGELWVRSPMLMQGYYLDPETTAQAIVDGWFATGDLASRSADGYLWFHARKKDIIRRRGENISGAELDEVIVQHPAIQAAAAIAVASELGEDEILVAVVLKPDHKLTALELREWCSSRLNATKLPRFVSFVEAMPYTPSHRVSKFQLRQDPSVLARAIDVHQCS